MTCAVYIRKSREDKNKPGHRLTVQRQQLPEHARAQGWQVQIYDDGHASASRGAVLPQRGRLEADIRAGQIDIILTIELSRLSRDDSLQDYVGWLHLCIQHQVKLATLSRVLDPDQHSDWMLLLMEGGFSSVEMKVLKQRMQQGRDEARRAGRYITGTPPWPYRYDRTLKKPVPDPDQVKLARKIWQLTATHSARRISDDYGINYTQVRRLLNDDRLMFCQGLTTNPDTGETIAGDWTAIITAEDAARIRKNRTSRKTGTKTASRSEPATLFSQLKLLKCGYCGRSVHRWMNSNTRRDGTRLDYLACNSKRRAGICPESKMVAQVLIEEKIISNMLRTLADTDDLKRAWLEQQDGGPASEELALLDIRERETKKKKKRLITAITEGVIDFTEAREKKAELDTLLDTITNRKTEIYDTQTDEPDWDSLSLTRDDWDLLTFNEQRELLPLIIHQVRIFAGHMLITYNFPRHNGDPTSKVVFQAVNTRKLTLQTPEK